MLEATLNRKTKAATPSWTASATPDAVLTGVKDTLQNQSYTALKATLLAGRFKPGEVVSVRVLAEMLGTSAMPIREALRRLTSEAAFEALPNRSARVPRLTRKQVTEILDLRVELEGRAAEQAAKNISLIQLEGLQTMQAEMERRVRAGDFAGYTSINQDFHFTIYRIADNEALFSLIEALWLRTAPLLSWLGLLHERQPESARKALHHHHDRLLKAFQNRDVDAARHEMQADIIDATKTPGYWDGIESFTYSTDRPTIRKGKSKKKISTI